MPIDCCIECGAPQYEYQRCGPCLRQSSTAAYRRAGYTALLDSILPAFSPMAEGCRRTPRHPGCP